MSIVNIEIFYHCWKYEKILFKKGSIENGCTLVNYGYFVELNLQRDIFFA